MQQVVGSGSLDPKNKYSGHELGYVERGWKVYELVCIKDGTLAPFVDKGPHPVLEDGTKVPHWRNLAPTPSRANLLAQLAKVDDAGLPIWFATVPGLKVWDQQNRREVLIPCINGRDGKVREDIKAAMDAYAKVREHLMSHGKALRDKYVAQMKSEAQTDEARLVSVFAKVLEKLAAGKPLTVDDDDVKEAAAAVGKKNGGAPKP